VTRLESRIGVQSSPRWGWDAPLGSATDTSKPGSPEARKPAAKGGSAAGPRDEARCYSIGMREPHPHHPQAVSPSDRAKGPEGHCGDSVKWHADGYLHVPRDDLGQVARSSVVSRPEVGRCPRHRPTPRDAPPLCPPFSGGASAK